MTADGGRQGRLTVVGGEAGGVPLQGGLGEGFDEIAGRRGQVCLAVRGWGKGRNKG